jgi:heavy metal sensor kinase
MKKLSIGSRLTLWYLAIFTTAQFLFGVGMWFALRQHLYNIADDTLAEQVEDVATVIRTQKQKNRTVPKLQEEVGEAYDLEHSGDFLQIYDQDGNWIYRASFMSKSPVGPVAPSLVKKRSFSTLELANQPYRLITQRIEANGRAFTVQTAVPIAEMLATLHAFERYLLILAPLMLLVAGSGGYWLSRRALSPVDAITQTARNIGEGNLSARLEKVATGDELERLSETLNEMLARLETAFSRVTQFTADASHELRTPISLIRTEAEVALRTPQQKEEYCDALRHILLEAERTSSLIEELLSLARADSGRERFSVALVELNSVVAEVGKEWRPLIENRDLRFVQAVGKGKLGLLADRNALERLVTILLDNAMKYTPPPGTVELRVHDGGGKAVIIVTDTGIGIAPEDQSRIFERFYRADKARSREIGGAGLGLAIADWIVKQHSGSISVESIPGQGSKFTVELPLMSADHSLSRSSHRDVEKHSEPFDFIQTTTREVF